MANIQSVGTIGFGSFGRFVATLIPDDTTVLWCDKDNSQRIGRTDLPNLQRAGLEGVASADVVVLAIPLEAYGTVLPQLARRLKPQTLVIDICSVKIEPFRLLQKHLPSQQPVLITHPLFGPQSASRGNTKGRELIVTKSAGDKAAAVVAYCEQELGLVIRRTTNEEHDRAMAQVHALTFFVAHALAKARVGEDVAFVTPSFKSLLDLVALDKTHTAALFKTIEQGNPFAQAARRHLLQIFETIEQELTKPQGTS